jgi:hypothetical protein
VPDFITLHPDKSTIPKSHREIKVLVFVIFLLMGNFLQGQIYSKMWLLLNNSFPGKTTAPVKDKAPAIKAKKPLHENGATFLLWQNQ